MIKKLSFFLSVLVLSSVFGYFIFAWTEPGSTPPGGNVPAPLNVGPDTQTKTGGLNLGGDLTVSGGDITVSKEGNYSSIYFPAQTNDPGYIQHYESSNTGRLYLMPGDDWASNDAVIVKGTDESWAHELRTDGWLGVASGIYDRTDGTLNVSDSLSVTGNLTVSGSATADSFNNKTLSGTGLTCIWVSVEGYNYATAYCPSGYTLTGGGCYRKDAVTHIPAFGRIDSIGYRCYFRRVSDNAYRTGGAHARCCRVR